MVELPALFLTNKGVWEKRFTLGEFRITIIFRQTLDTDVSLGMLRHFPS